MRILLLIALFSATWISPSIARLSWSQPAGVAQTCLTRNATLVHCWNDLPPGATVLRLGASGPLDGAYRPAAGDVYTLTMDGATERAALRGVVYVPMARRSGKSDAAIFSEIAAWVRWGATVPFVAG